MELTTYFEKQTYVIELRDELTIHATRILNQALENAILIGPKWVWINCRSLHHVSPAGLDVLLYHIERFQYYKIHLVFFHVNPEVKQLLAEFENDIHITVFSDNEINSLLNDLPRVFDDSITP